MILLPQTAKETARFLPHSGSMCLIDQVETISDLTITVKTYSHHQHDNPLKFLGKLPSITGIEYAAQAVALHLALNKKDNAFVKNQGVLAAVKQCRIHIEYLDSISSALHIYCQQMYLPSESGALYEFNIQANDQAVLSGKLLIMFNQSSIRVNHD